MTGMKRLRLKQYKIHRNQFFKFSLFILIFYFSTMSCVSSGLVPLHNACSYGHYEVAELLVRHGASVNVADLWKFTPLHEAAAKGKYEICKLLLKVVFFVKHLSNLPQQDQLHEPCSSVLNCMAFRMASLIHSGF